MDKATLFFNQLEDWTKKQKDIRGVAIVGSYARGDYHSESDIDLVIISTHKDITLSNIKKNFHYTGMKSSSLEEWGTLTSLRVFYDNGLEVEFGVVTDQWVTEPLDEGTKKVVENGFRILIEKENIFCSVNKYLNQI